MSFTISSYDSANVVHMPEKLTMANANSVKQQLTEMIDDGKTNLVIDLAGMSFTDSSGLAVLVAVYKNIQKLGGSAVILSPQPAVQSLLELTRLQELFEIYQDPNAAIERVSQAA